jgi:hypothetical protein
MAEQQSTHTTEGTLMMGADGAVYFIPKKQLEAFRISDEAAKVAIEDRLHRLGKPSDISPDVKVFQAVQGLVGFLPQATPTTVPGFVDFGQRNK